MIRRSGFGIFLAAAVSGLAACGGSLFQSKAAQPAIYVLSAASKPAGAGPSPAAAAPSAVPAAAPAIDLAILKPRLHTGLESDRIAVLYPDRRLDYFADARWSGALGDVVQDLAVQVFQSNAGLRAVSGDVSVFASAYWLEIEVTDFQAEYTAAEAPPTVHVHLLARLGASADRRLLGRFEADFRQPAAENRLSAIVDAYARAANAALEDIVARTDERLGAVSDTRSEIR